ncbi:predicted protein [Naegleria gruberi]|uniref:Predicted protein n=1 Tax=Naegleria gruberi TaxID=5762 RepID=D2V3G9_NAEGR|nr:uncharacterized protein NAEGRDRAFT_63358 [Naegleria gruberi]EFC48636.1 predicted protein [Naegleria gruberi]|eukprot:XP_002681380.1 predicted protein [Naegleria gruberi strain NEG-M]
MFSMVVFGEDLQTLFNNASENYYSLSSLLTDKVCENHVAISKRSHLTRFTHRMHAKYEDFTKSGIYYAIILNCDTDSSQKSMTITTGTIRYTNPFGQLSAEQYSNLPFYAIMSIATFSIGIIYILSVLGFEIECKRPFGIQFIKKLLFWRKDTTRETQAPKKKPEKLVGSYSIIVWICVVLLLFLFENSFSFAMYQYIDMNGLNSNFLYTGASLFHMLRKLFSRVFILLLCMGYGSIRDIIGGVKSILIWTYAFVYAMAVIASELVDMLFIKVHLMSPFVASILSTPIIFLDIIAFLWIIGELFTLMKQLKRKGQGDRLSVFISLTVTIIFYFIATVGWVVYSYFILDNSDQFQYDKRWETNWTVGAVWSIIFMVVMIAIMVIFRKSNIIKVQRLGIEKEQKYAQLSQNDDEDQDVKQIHEKLENEEELDEIIDRKVQKKESVDTKRPGFTIDDISEEEDDGDLEAVVKNN